MTTTVKTIWWTIGISAILGLVFSIGYLINIYTLQFFLGLSTAFNVVLAALFIFERWQHKRTLAQLRRKEEPKGSNEPS